MLQQLFNPAAIAIISASDDIRRPGGYQLHALIAYRYPGTVYPVNPRRTEINGRPCYPDARALPGRCDLAIIGVPAANVPAALEDCGKAGIPFAIVLSAGFREIGEKGRALQAELDAAIERS